MESKQELKASRPLNGNRRRPTLCASRKLPG
jgi:hypothetical protein